jgi:hypothetical protein
MVNDLSVLQLLRDRPLSTQGVSIMVRVTLCVWLAWSVPQAFGCDCIAPSVHQAKKGAEVIFRGTITDIHDGKVIFRVNRVWKGDVEQTFEMVDFPESGCLGFLNRWLRVGNDLLVFAWRLRRYLNDNEYFTSICTKTSTWSEASDTLKKLGKGRPPRGSPSTPRR